VGEREAATRLGRDTGAPRRDFRQCRPFGKRGALLNSGSDPIGDAGAPLPPPELFARFQEMTRIVYISGQHDAVNGDKDSASTQSLLEWCVFDWHAERPPWMGHEAAGSTVLSRALDMLEQHAKPDSARLNKCRLRINQELGKEIDRVNELLAAGNVSGARRLLNKIDTRYGGLAAPRSAELAARMDGMD
jgi:hypothetical protein